MTAGDFTLAAIVGGFILNFLGVVIGGTWKLSRLEASITEKLSKHRREVDADVDQAQREVGEALAALRAKTNEVELYIRDNYVRRESFYEVSTALSGQMKMMEDKIEARLSRFDAKLDRMNDRAIGRDHLPGGG